MNTTHIVPALGPALPEIILAVGALALILVGAIRGERSTPVVSASALVILGVALLAVLMQPAERVEALSGSFYRQRRTIVGGRSKWGATRAGTCGLLP